MTAADLLAAENADAKALGLTFTADWWARTGYNLVSWMKHVHPRYAGKPNVRFLEIGCLEGRSAIWIMRNVLTDAGAHLTCVDIFDGAYEQLFDANTKTAGVANRIEKLVGPSVRSLRSLDDGAFDLIYVDGAHETPAVLTDAVLSWPLLKVGGLLVFDDYPLEVGGGGPGPAIDAFLDIFQAKLRILEKDWQVFIEKHAR